ncbi:unnamed protein product [Tilletia caries]|nr:unnamed protein product [Tilletia caries]
MRLQTFGLWAASVVLLLTSAQAAANRRKIETVVIVSFRSDQGKGQSAQNDETLHNGFEKYLNGRNITYKPRFRFKDVRMPLGSSLALSSENDVPKLYGYAAVEQVEIIQGGPSSAFEKRVRKQSTSSSSAPSAHRAHFPPRAVSAPAQTDTYGPHVMVGADKLHNEGSFGAGIKVGVIDTGIDYTHPAFGNCYGKPGCTVVGGYSFVSDNNTIALSTDPRPDCDDYGIESSWGHGTHVAGVIGAHDNVRNFTGMAPQALISAYRIASCTGISAPDIAAAAIVKAYQDGMDIISMSFSFASGWQQAFVARIVSSVVSLGTPVVLSMGNSGETGMFDPTSPTLAKGAYSVASVQNKDLYGYTFAIKSSKSSDSKVNTTVSSYLSTNPIKMTSSLPVYVSSKKVNNPNDGCDEYPDSTPNLAKYVTLIGAAKVSAKYVLYYSDTSSELVYADQFVERGDDMQAGTISNADGVRIAKLAAAGNKVTFDFSAPKSVVLQNTVTGGLMGTYSQYSPSWTAGGLPGAAGVGGLVLSTWPVKAGSYEILSGTSFSTPMVAGAMALYRSIKGKSETPEQLNAIFTTTAKPVPYSKNSTLLNTVAQTGGGLIDVYRAVKSTTRVWPYQLLLNDTHNFNGSQKLTISNIGTQSQTFTLGHLPAGTAYSQDGSGKDIYLEGPIANVAQDQAGVRFSPASVTIAPGRSQDVQVVFTAPNADPKKLAVYSGYVQLKSNQDLGTLTVPYMGVAVDFSTIKTINMTVADGQRQTRLVDPSGKALTSDNNTYNLKGFEGQLQLVWGLNVGSQQAVFSLVKANTSFVPTYRQGQSGRNIKYCSTPLSPSDVVATLSKQILLDRGQGDPFYQYIGSQYTDAQGVDRTVPDGYFRVLLQVLRPMSDPAKACSYESYLSRAFHVKK